MKNNKKIILMFAPASLVVIFSFISTIVQGLALIYAIKFIVCQLAFVLFPGILWLSLFRREKWDYVQFVVYAFVLGFMQAYPIYFLTVPFSKGKFTPYVYLMWIAVSCIVWFFFNRREKVGVNISVNQKEVIIVCCTIAVLMLVNTVTMGGANFLPDRVYTVNSYYQDHLYFCGNIAELAKEFPPINFRAIFQNYSYHYFYSMQLAVVENFTNIPAFEVGTYFSYIQVDFILGFAVVFLFDKVIGRLPLIGKIIGLFALFFSTGCEEKTAMTYVETIFFVPNGIDMAYAMGFIMLSCVMIQIRKEKINVLDLIITLAAFFVCLGTKGPLGIVYGGVVGVLLLLYMIKTHRCKVFFTYAIGFLCVAIPLIFVVYYDNIISSLSMGSVNSVGEEARSIYSYEHMVSVVNWAEANIGIPLLREVLLFFAYIFMCNMPIMLLLLVCIEVLIFRIIKFEIEDYTFLGIIFIAAIVTCVVAHPGLSQTYFLQAAMPLAVFIVMRTFSKVYAVFQNERRLRNAIVGIVTVVVFSGGIYLFSGGFSLFTEHSLLRGWQYTVKSSEIDYEHEWEVNSVTKSELDAYKWIRRETPEKARFVCDTALYGYAPYAYCPGVFSERHMYVPLDDIEICSKLLQGDSESWQEITQYNIKYMILTKRVSQGKELSEEYGKKIFENDDVKVYQFIK